MRKKIKPLLVLAVITPFIIVGLSLLGLIDTIRAGETGFHTPAPVERTGQTKSHANEDDGALKKGVAWPRPRFNDNGDGTVTDKLTGLVWLKNANCDGGKNWEAALDFCKALTSGSFGIADGSVAGDWRLPNIKELASVIDYGRYNPALPPDHPFTNVQPDYYWSSTTYTYNTPYAWLVYMKQGIVYSSFKTSNLFVWPVRDCQ